MEFFVHIVGLDSKLAEVASKKQWPAAAVEAGLLHIQIDDNCSLLKYSNLSR